MSENSIPTIILCGGKGMRLREETEFKPKPMVEIGGKPILWHIMKIYSFYGYKDFILALGYKGNYIKEYFLNERKFNTDFLLERSTGKIIKFFDNYEIKKDNWRIIFADTGLETPHGERVLMLKKYIKGDLFMVTYGDGVANINIKKLVAFHRKKKVIGTITGVHPTSRWGLVSTDKSWLVTEFSQKPDFYDYVNGGFMVFHRKVFDYLKPGMMIEDVFNPLIKEKQLALFPHEGFWYGMDTYRDFEKLNELWIKGAPWKIW